MRTFNVAISAYEITGAALPKGKVTFELTAPDVAGGIIAPMLQTVTLDNDGTGTIALWPNGDGAAGTQYKVALRSHAGGLQFSGLVTMPANDCTLHSIIDTGPPPTVDAATTAKLAAQASAGAASVSASAASGSASSAATSASSSAGSASAAATSASAAAGSASGAATSAGSASTSAATATTQAAAAAQSASDAAATLSSKANIASPSFTGSPDVQAPARAAGVSTADKYSLKLSSSFAGGENTSDSTGRLELESYQRAQTHAADGTTYAQFGEVIRIYSRKHNSKQMISYYGPTSYDGNGDPVGPDTAWTWLGAHYDANDGGAAHGHFSIETPDANGDLQTRMEFRIWDPTTHAFGMDKTIIKYNAADVIVAQDNGALWMAAAAGLAKNLYFTNDTTVVSGGAGKRWGLQHDTAAESTGNVGSDFRINRYGDTGAFIQTALCIQRSTGAIGIGGLTPTSTTPIAAKLDVTESGARHTIQATQTGAGAVAYAAYSGQLGNVANKLFDGRVIADTTARVVMYGDGKQEWGPGNSVRDANLYRSGPATLTADGSLVVGGVSPATGAVVGHAILATQASPLASNFAALAAQTAIVGNKALDIRVTGDATGRFAVYGDGVHQWGDGTVVRDTNLYRFASASLKTDGSFAVGGALTVTGAATINGQPIGQNLFAKKTANEVVNNSAAVQDDDHLTLSVVASAVYELSAMFIYDGTSTADMKLGFVGPSGAALDWVTHSLDATAASGITAVKMTYQNLSGTPSFGAIGAGSKVVAKVSGLLTTDVTVGTFKVQWAQNTAEATNTTMYSGSYLSLRRIS